MIDMGEDNREVMRMDKKRDIFVMLPFIFLLFGCCFLCYNNTYQHENVHKQIKIHDGCKDVDIVIGLPLGVSYTVCLDSNYIESDTAQILNAQNEIVSYNLTTLIYCLVICSLFIGLCICWGD